jgi:hypothetical protein
MFKCVNVKSKEHIQPCIGLWLPSYEDDWCLMMSQQCWNALNCVIKYTHKSRFLQTSPLLLRNDVHRTKRYSIQCLMKQHAMKTCGRVEVKLHAFLVSTVNGGEWSASRSGRLPLLITTKYIQGGQCSRSGRFGKPESNSDSSVAQSIAVDFADWAITRTAPPIIQNTMQVLCASCRLLRCRIGIDNLGSKPFVWQRPTQRCAKKSPAMGRNSAFPRKKHNAGSSQHILLTKSEISFTKKSKTKLTARLPRLKTHFLLLLLSPKSSWGVHFSLLKLMFRNLNLTDNSNMCLSTNISLLNECFLQAWMSRVQFLMWSLIFFIALIFSAFLWSWGQLIL